MIHGFNSPQKDVLTAYAEASRAIESDPAICNRAGLVCVGYCWPSEKMGEPWRANARRSAFLSLLAVSAAVSFCLRCIHFWACSSGSCVEPSGWTSIAAVLGAALLRATVYFRDTYRATNYGAPDLIEIIRQIDHAIIKHDLLANAASGMKARIRIRIGLQLSFIGHSMGGFVVTNAIRVLSDLFAKDALRPRLNAGTVNEQTGGEPRGDSTEHRQCTQAHALRAGVAGHLRRGALVQSR